MNIFVLHPMPDIAARMQCDRHVVKMTLETAQMLSTAINELGGQAPYKSAHINHPCSVRRKAFVATQRLSVSPAGPPRHSMHVTYAQSPATVVCTLAALTAVSDPVRIDRHDSMMRSRP